MPRLTSLSMPTIRFTRWRVGLLVTIALAIPACGSSSPGAAPPSTFTNRPKTVTSLPLGEAFTKPLAPGESVPLAREAVQRIGPKTSKLPSPSEPSAQDPPEAFGTADQLAASPDGSLYASITEQDRIVRVDPAGVASLVKGADGAPLPAGAIAVDPTGNLWVANTDAVRAIAPDGAVTVVHGNLPPVTDNEMLGPIEDAVGQPFGAVAFRIEKIAVGAAGRLVLLTGGGGLLEVGPDRIVRRSFDAATVPITDGGPRGKSASGFESAGDIELLPDGTLLVLDISARMLRAVTPQGTLATWAGRSAKVVDSKVGPLEDAWDMTVTKEGTALVALRAPGKIVEVRPDGSIIDWTTSEYSPDRVALLADGTLAARLLQDQVSRIARR